MSSLADLVAAFPTRLAIMVAVGGVFFLIYFLIDIYLFFTRHHFGRINVYLVHFTRNDNPRRSNTIRFFILKDSIFLKRVYDNRFLFWRVIFRSWKASFTNPVVDFGKHCHAALAPLRDHLAAKYSIGVIKRSAGSTFEELFFRIVMINDRTREKRRILRVLLIQEKDLEEKESYLKDPPMNSGNLDIFKKVAQALENSPTASLPLEITVA